MNTHKIDLRSDTLTTPTDEMRQAMLNAIVGDDVYGEDPTVNRLQDMIAQLFGKEAALFVPTGVMGNQIAIAVHTSKGDEVIVESESHLFHYETAAPSVISAVQMHCIPSKKGEMSLDDISQAIRSSEYYFPETTLICIEQTHNRHGGTVLSLDYMESLHQLAKDRNVPVHCDGARIWNACAASGVQPHEYAKHVDTLSVCLSKGLGAPVGSLFIGTKKHVQKALHWRKLLGGGMRQIGFLGAAGIHAVEYHRDNLKVDHHHATTFARMIEEQTHVRIANSSGTIDTNIVIIDCGESPLSATLQTACAKEGLLLSSGRGNYLRAVFYRDISIDDVNNAVDIFCSCYTKLKSDS